MSKLILLIKLEAVKERSTIHLNFDDKLLAPEIKAAQDQQLEPVLGSGLYARLLQGVDAKDLSPDEKNLLDNYVANVVIHYVLAALPMSASFQFFTKGVVRQTDQNAELPSMADLIQLSAWYTDRAEFYAQRLIKYLKKNRGKFPQYDSDPDADLPAADSGYSMQCWLDD
jgi:hypothetical protein